MNDYNILLNNIEEKLGTETTFSTELDILGKRLLGRKFRGVYPSDCIPKLNYKKRYCILNLDNSIESGSHWIALAKINNKESIIYDSFGRGYTQIIPKLKYSGNGRIIDTDDDAEQAIYENNCGQRCLAWLLYLKNYGSDKAASI